MAEWASDKILGSSFITHSTPNGYEIHFATPDRKKYLAVQEECRKQIGHEKPMTNADRIRAMSDEELDKFLGEVQWDVANYCGGVTQKQEYPVPEQRGVWLDWLKQEVSE